MKRSLRILYEFAVVVLALPYYYIAKSFGKKFYGKKDIPKLANVNLKEPYDVYIGRPNYHLGLEGSIWGNPFPVDANGKHIHFKEYMREKVIADHMAYLRNNKVLLKQLHTLSGKTLGCYCTNYTFSKNNKIKKKCHGHNIIQMYITHVLGLDFNIFEE